MNTVSVTMMNTSILIHLTMSHHLSIGQAMDRTHKHLQTNHQMTINIQIISQHPNILNFLGILNILHIITLQDIHIHINQLLPQLQQHVVHQAVLQQPQLLLEVHPHHLPLLVQMEGEVQVQHQHQMDMEELLHQPLIQADHL